MIMTSEEIFEKFIFLKIQQTRNNMRNNPAFKELIAHIESLIIVMLDWLAPGTQGHRDYEKSEIK